MEKGKTQHEWEKTQQEWEKNNRSEKNTTEVGRNTPNVGKNTKRGGGEIRGIKMGCLAAVSTLTANPFGNLLEFQI